MSSIEDRFLTFLRARIAEMGVDPSGAYDYYEQRVKLGEGFKHYERVVMAEILARPPSRVVHAGVGIGQLTAALAEAGIAVVGYETDRTRYMAAVAWREAVGLEYDLKNVFYPDDDAGTGGLLLFTNVAAGWTPEREKAIVATIAKFDEAILDLRGFGRRRLEDGEREELRQCLGKIGTVEDLPPTSGFSYVRVRPHA